jgi:F-type H+-transporting ATPase subunit gamma
MAQARKILSRRKSVQNIRKITRTMEMVATARFKSIHDRAMAARPYINHIARLVHDLSNRADQIDHPLMKKHEDAPAQALVVLSSNRGLCGGYNMNVMRLARDMFHQARSEGKQVDIYAVGKKAANYLNFHKMPVLEKMPQFEGKPSFDAAAQLANQLMDRYARGELVSVKVVYMQFISTGLQRPKAITLMPLSELETPVEEPVGVPTGAAGYDFVPSPEEILGQLLPKTVRLRLYQAFLDAMVSEQVARMTAMRLATDNAEDMIRQLSIRYNRLRQATITTELAEIMSGAEALK